MLQGLFLRVHGSKLRKENPSLKGERTYRLHAVFVGPEVVGCVGRLK